MPDAGLGDLQVLGEIQAENFQGNAEIEPGVGVGDQVDHQVRLARQAIQVPFGAADVLLHEGQVGVTEELGDLVGREVDGGHRVSFLKQAPGEVGADETSGAQSEDLHALNQPNIIPHFPKTG